MGAFLEKPITDKSLDYGKNTLFSWAACEMQGWRKS